MAKLVSRVYAEALFALAKEENRMGEFYRGAESVLKYLKKDDRFLRLAERPDIPAEEKKRMAEMIFAPLLPKEMTGLILLLTEKRHTADLSAVFDRFARLVQEEKGIGHVCVTTPETLTDEKKERIRNRLSELTDYKELCIRYAVDRELLGGMVIRIGDWVMDASLRTGLQTLSGSLGCMSDNHNQKGIQDP